MKFRSSSDDADRQIDLNHNFSNFPGYLGFLGDSIILASLAITIFFSLLSGCPDRRQRVNFILPDEVRQGRAVVSGEHFRITYPSATGEAGARRVVRILERARLDLLARLQRASMDLPEQGPYEVIIHASTSDFVSATGQSGWAAGVTRGRRIELQPLAVLERRGILESTARHEMAHAAIEILGRGRTPRWLAEGLAVHFAGEGRSLLRAYPKSEFEPSSLEQKLERPASAREMRALYAEAYRRVLFIIDSEGEPKAWKLILAR